MKQTLKTSLLLLLCMVMLLSVLPAGANAQEDREWTEVGYIDSTTWFYDEADGLLLITGEGEMSSSWSLFRDSVTTLVVEEGITGEFGSFKDYTKLTSVTLPEGITELRASAFQGCTALTSITLPESVTTIGGSAFFGCTALAEISLPDSVTEIGRDAFRECTALTEIVLPESLAELGSCAFFDCTNLTEIHLPASLTYIGAQPFGGCSNLKGIWVDENNPKYIHDRYGVLYSKDMTTLKEAPGALEGDYVIPESVTQISDMAFYGCANLTSVQMPDTVQWLGLGTFQNCTSLSKINLSENTYEVPMDAFVNCSSLEEITIPASVTLVFPDAFKGCTGLKAVYFEGDAPVGEVSGDAFPGISAKAYYTPNETWTEKNRQRVSTSLDWVIPQLEAPKVDESNVSSTGKIKLKWNAIEGAESYEIYRRAGKTGSYKKLATTESNAYTDKDTTPGTVYYYKVKAIHENPDMNSEFSAAVGQTCDLPRPKLKDVTNSEGPIVVRWSKVEGAKEYAVYRATTKDGPYTKIGTSSGSHLTVKKSNPGTLYYFKIKAIHENSNANSAWSEILTCPGKLAAPNLYGRESNVKDTGCIKLTWEAREGAEGYEIIRRVNKKGEYEPYATTKDNFFIDTDVTPGIVYEYRARSIHSDSRANSGYGSSAGQTCDLPRPVVKESNDPSTGKVKLKWDKIEGAESYKIYRRVGKTGSYELLTSTESTSYTDKNTTPGTVYYYKVQAIHANSNANSAKSAGVGQTCDLPRPNVRADLSGDHPVLSWSKTTGAEEYKIYRATSKNGTYKLVKKTTKTSFTDEAVSTDKTYYYRVKAIHENTSANSAYCYIAADSEAGVQRTVTNAYVNIRSGAGTSYEKLGQYKKGDVVTIYEETEVDGRPWGRTDDGWICTEYVA